MMDNVSDIESNCTDKKSKKYTKRSLISEVFNDYCSHSSLHGISYLGDSDKSLLEKIWWIIIFITSFTTCIYLMTKAWIKWDNNPVILSFEKDQIPISDIPFPAVTICPVNKVYQDKYNYTELFRNRNNLSEEDYKMFWDISLICNIDQYVVPYNCTFNTTDDDVIANIMRYSPITAHTISEWQGRYSFRFVSVQITEEGLCYTFNTFSQEDMFTSEMNNSTFYSSENRKNSGWSIEDGYKTRIRKTDYPRRTAIAGISSGFSLTLQTNLTRIDYVCGLPMSGFMLILHNPAEKAQVAEQYYLIPENRKVNVKVQPELTKTSKSLLSLPPRTRNCYYSKEKSLRFFKLYTQSNCRVECNANITLNLCDCVAFYMPRDRNTSICGFAKMECVRIVEDIIVQISMTQKSDNISTENQIRIENTRAIYNYCDCLPSCTSLKYSAEITHTKYHLVKAFLAAGILNDRVLEDFQNDIVILTQIDIFFKEAQFFALQRGEFYNNVDFLADCGGLLGLFMGFSVLSLLEIIYFLTIRIWIKYTIKNN